MVASPTQEKGDKMLITCAECLERLYPEDPRVITDGHCGCYYCSKPFYYRELEKTKEIEVKDITSEWGNNQWDYVQQIKSELLHYRKEYARLMTELDKLNTYKKRKQISSF